MEIKLLVTLEVDPLTGSAKVISSEQYIPEETPPVIKDCTLTLLDNTFVLSNDTIELMDVKAGDRLDIQFMVIDGKSIPMIGKPEDFGLTGGNKLTKSNSVSFRGVGNQGLRAFGTEYEIEPFKDGLFRLISKNAVDQVVDDNVSFEEEIPLPEEEVQTSTFVADPFDFHTPQEITEEPVTVSKEVEDPFSIPASNEPLEVVTEAPCIDESITPPANITADDLLEEFKRMGL